MITDNLLKRAHTHTHTEDTGRTKAGHTDTADGRSKVGSITALRNVWRESECECECPWLLWFVDSQPLPPSPSPSLPPVKFVLISVWGLFIYGCPLACTARNPQVSQAQEPPFQVRQSNKAFGSPQMWGNELGKEQLARCDVLFTFSRDSMVTWCSWEGRNNLITLLHITFQGLLYFSKYFLRKPLQIKIFFLTIFSCLVSALKAQIPPFSRISYFFPI